MSDEQVYRGEVIWFKLKPGWGFIHWEKNGVRQTDMFAHYSDISMEGFKLLKAGQKVSFKIGKNHAGQDKAIEITVLDE